MYFWLLMDVYREEYMLFFSIGVCVCVGVGGCVGVVVCVFYLVCFFWCVF